MSLVRGLVKKKGFRSDNGKKKLISRRTVLSFILDLIPFVIFLIKKVLNKNKSIQQ